MKIMFCVPRSVFRKRKGFTLVELLIVIAVTALLSSYLVSYQKSGQRQITLFIEEQKIASMIFQAKSLAIESFIKTDHGNCGYGVYVNYSSRLYGIFYYATSTNESKLIQCPAIKKNGRLMPGQIIPFLVFGATSTPLHSDLVFPNPNSFTDSLYYVLFVPPDPQTLIVDKNRFIMTGSGSIRLQTVDSLASGAVTVNPVGQVNF